MTTATLEKNTHLREKKGPLEIFHRLNTTYLTTLQELNKHAITKKTLEENETRTLTKAPNTVLFHIQSFVCLFFLIVDLG